MDMSEASTRRILRESAKNAADVLENKLNELLDVSIVFKVNCEAMNVLGRFYYQNMCNKLKSENYTLSTEDLTVLQDDINAIITTDKFVHLWNVYGDGHRDNIVNNLGQLLTTSVTYCCKIEDAKQTLEKDLAELLDNTITHMSIAKDYELATSDETIHKMIIKRYDTAIESWRNHIDEIKYEYDYAPQDILHNSIPHDIMSYAIIKTLLETTHVKDLNTMDDGAKAMALRVVNKIKDMLSQDKAIFDSGAPFLVHNIRTGM